jgi:hypothetical protein
MIYLTTQPRVDDTLAFVRAVRKIAFPISGEPAAVVAGVIHAAKIDNGGQLGNAYFECHREYDGAMVCEGVLDCTEEDQIDIAFILADGVRCPECDWAFTVEDLRISDGWLERDLATKTKGATIKAKGANRRVDDRLYP